MNSCASTATQQQRVCHFILLLPGVRTKAKVAGDVACVADKHRSQTKEQKAV